MPLEEPARVVRELTSRGYNAERAAVTLLADEPEPVAAVERVVEAVPDDALTISVDDVRAALDAPGTGADRSSDGEGGADRSSGGGAGTDRSSDGEGGNADGSTTVSGRGREGNTSPSPSGSPGETEGVSDAPGADTGSAGRGREAARRDADPSARSVEVSGDVTGRSTGTGEYGDFVSVFRDRYKQLSKQLRSRVNHRPAEALESMPGGSEAAIVGMVNDLRSTAGGHWLVELEDPSGTFPALILEGRDVAGRVDELLLDEVVGVEGSLADDGEILFVDALHFPDVPRTHRPTTADRPVRAALISDVHVGSQEFVAEAWHGFADWLHTEEAAGVEYLLVAGDMVEGVGVYPGQDEELDLVDIYEQYEAFAEHLKEVPGDLEVVMIPGNHDAVRLAEPQPAFDEELRELLSVHDARVVGNPSTVTLEGVSVLMYHGVSLDEVIAELPEGKASYDEPHRAMFQLLRKRHLAPQYGGEMRIAPEERDYLVIDAVPDVFHTGHVHKLGYGKYHNVLGLNTGCWQAQTAFQRSVNIDPDVGYAGIVDLDTLDLTWRKFV